MKRFLCLGLLCALLVTTSVLFYGCGTETVNVNVTEGLDAKVNTMFDTYYNKNEGTELAAPTLDNFYVEISSEYDSNVEIVTINGTGHTANEKLKFSVGNNNFVETPAWQSKDGKLYVAIPVLFVEAKGGVTTINAGNKEFKVTVYEEGNGLTLESVTVVGTTEGATAEKTTNKDGKIVINHTRKSGKSAVGWTLKSGEETVPANKYCFAKKVVSDTNKISYGIDLTSDAKTKGYTQGLYNYWLNGNITEPVNRTIDYTLTVVGYGTINFDVNITEVSQA